MAGTTTRWFLRLRESFRSSGKKDECKLRQDPGYCKPLSLQTCFTVVTLVYTVALIVALEYCFRTLPISDARRDIPNGTESEIYGPFNWAPLARLADTAETGSASSLTFKPWNSSATITPGPTITESPAPSSTSSETDRTEDSPNGAVFFGTRPGVLGFGLDHPVHDNTTHDNSTGTLSRRVPPPDKWGQLPGRLQLVQFDVSGRHYPPPGEVWAIIEYFYQSDPKSPLFAELMNDELWCPAVCDGPALVFLATKCWEKWNLRASMYTRDTKQWPTAIHTNLDLVWMEGTPCPTAVATTPIAVAVPPKVRITTTMSSRTVDVEIIEVTTISGQPTTLTSTTQIVLPVEPVPVEDNPGPGPTLTRPAQVSAEPTDDGWSPTTTITQRDNQGRPTATITGRIRATEAILTLTNPDGRPTATLTTAIPLISSAVTFSGTDGVITTSTVLVPAYKLPGQERSVLTLTNSDGTPVATVTIDPDYGPRTKPRPGTHASGDSADADDFEFHPISWGDYLFASFAPILATLPLAWLVQMQSGSLKALLPYFILSSSSSFSTGRSRSSSVGHDQAPVAGGRAATAAESLCLATGGPRGIWNGVYLFFVGTSTSKRKEPLGFLADMHVIVLSAIVSLSSEALAIKLIGRCRVDDFRGCHMGVSLFMVPGRIVQALLGVSLALGVLNALVLLQRAEWKRAVDIYSRHGNTGVEGTAELLDGGSDETRGYFKKVAGSAAEEADTNGDGYISTKEMAKHLDDHLFAIRVRTNMVMNSSSAMSLSETSRGEKKSDGSRIPPVRSIYYLEATPRDPDPGSDSTNTWSTGGSDASDAKGEGKLSRSETIKSWLGPLKSISLTPARQDLLGQLGFLLAMIGLMVLVMYYELTSNPDSPFEKFMNSQSLGVRSLFTAMGVVVSLFWDNHYSEISTREPYRQLVISSSSSASLATAFLKWNHVIILTAIGAALSKITPLLLSNVSFSPWLTWLTHQACTWSVVGVLGFMILVVCFTSIRASLAEKSEPHMPVHPGTLGGRLFYVARYKGH